MDLAVPSVPTCLLSASSSSTTSKVLLEDATEGRSDPLETTSADLMQQDRDDAGVAVLRAKGGEVLMDESMLARSERSGRSLFELDRKGKGKEVLNWSRQVGHDHSDDESEPHRSQQGANKISRKTSLNTARKTVEEEEEEGDDTPHCAICLAPIINKVSTFMGGHCIRKIDY